MPTDTPPAVKAPIFPEELRRHLAEQRTRQKEIIPPGLPIPAGQRQATLFSNGMALRVRGFSEEAIDTALRAMNKDRCTPPLNDHRMQELMKGVMRSNMDYTVEPGLTRIRAGEDQPLNWEESFSKERERVGWLPRLDGIAIQARITNLYGPAGVGKSELALQRATEAARAGVRVLWLDREMTEEDAVDRLQDMGYAAADLDNLIYYLYPSLPWLDTAEGGEELVEMAKRYEADVVFLDSLSKFVKGEEKDSGTATKFYVHSMLPLKESGVASVTIDHTGKDITAGARGTSAKKDNVDLYMEVTRAGNRGTRLTTGKQRHSWVESLYMYNRKLDPIQYTLHNECVSCGKMAETYGGPKSLPVCYSCRSEMG